MDVVWIENYTLNCSSRIPWSETSFVWYQPQYTGIEIVFIPHDHSNISIPAQLGIVDSQFHEIAHCDFKVLFGSQMVSFIVLMNKTLNPKKGYPSRFL